MEQEPSAGEARRPRLRKRARRGALFQLERWFEWLLFQSRWLVAPIYLGLVSALMMLLFVFFMLISRGVNRLVRPDAEVQSSLRHSEEQLHQVVVDALSFIDIALVANLVLIVIFAGYYHFVSKIEFEDDEDWPPWMVEVDFADLKLKLFASIIALTGIELLKAFMELRTEAHPDRERLFWLVGIHVTFLFTGLFSALADRLTSHLRKSG